jgi:hypothetical protein
LVVVLVCAIDVAVVVVATVVFLLAHPCHGDAVCRDRILPGVTPNIIGAGIMGKKKG